MVAPSYNGKFKTIECQIMDLADDIAYSTYDLEDTFKAGFLTPLDLLAKYELYESVAGKMSRATGETISGEEVGQLLLDLFGELEDAVEPGSDFRRTRAPLVGAAAIYDAASRLARDG